MVTQRRDRDTDANDTFDERLYVAQDANYNATAIFDNSGHVVERYVYDPFGQATILTPDWAQVTSSLFGWQHLHQGLRFESVTGLYHNRMREYSPTLMRFVSVDPAGMVDGANLYWAYVNTPSTAVDPSGLGFWRGVLRGAMYAAVGVAVVGAVVLAAPVVLPAAAASAVVTTTVATAAFVGTVSVGVVGIEAATGREVLTGRTCLPSNRLTAA